MFGDDVGVGVSGKQKNLKKQHAGRPDRWSTTEPRQDKFSEDELSPEKKESAKKNGDRKS